MRWGRMSCLCMCMHVYVRECVCICTTNMRRCLCSSTLFDVTVEAKKTTQMNIERTWLIAMRWSFACTRECFHYTRDRRIIRLWADQNNLSACGGLCILIHFIYWDIAQRTTILFYKKWCIQIIFFRIKKILIYINEFVNVRMRKARKRRDQNRIFPSTR